MLQLTQYMKSGRISLQKSEGDPMLDLYILFLSYKIIFKINV